MPFPFIVAHECRDEYYDRTTKEIRIRTREWLAFDDVNHFLSKRNMFPHSHEVMINRYGENKYAKLQGRLVFDFDFEEDKYRYGTKKGEFVHPGFEKTIEKLIIQVFKIYYIDINLDILKFIWLISDTEKKWSKHLIVKNTLFCEDWKVQIQTFYQLMLSEAKQVKNEHGNVLIDYLGPIDNLFDYQIARNNATMRMCGSSKIGGKTLKVDKEYTKTEISFTDTLIQQFNPEDVDKEQEIRINQLRKDILEKIFQNPEKMLNDPYLAEACNLAELDLTKGNNEYESDDLSREMVNKYMKAFNIYWCAFFEVQEQIAFRVKSVSGHLIILERIRPHKCLISEREHENENAFLTVSGNYGYFHCYRKCKTDEEKKSLLFAVF